MLNKSFQNKNVSLLIENKAVHCSYKQGFELNQVSPTSTVMSGKFGLASVKSQENVREFCYVQPV